MLKEWDKIGFTSEGFYRGVAGGPKRAIAPATSVLIDASARLVSAPEHRTACSCARFGNADAAREDVDTTE